MFQLPRIKWTQYVHFPTSHLNKFYSLKYVLLPSLEETSFLSFYHLVGWLVIRSLRFSSIICFYFPFFLTLACMASQVYEEMNQEIRKVTWKIMKNLSLRFVLYQFYFFLSIRLLILRFTSAENTFYIWQKTFFISGSCQM
jgi:hypothetical protein